MGQQSSRSIEWLKDVDMYKGFNLETCQKIWSHYDTNASGLLERDEALAFCNEYCSAHGLGPDQRNHIIASFFKTFDVNTDGSISWEELYGSATITGVFREMLNKMPQVLGLLATDREGVVVGRALSQSLDNDKVRSRDHLFNSQFPLLAEQASKLHIGDNKSITAFFDNMIIIHFDYSPIILTVVGATDANIDALMQLGEALKACLSECRANISALIDTMEHNDDDGDDYDDDDDNDESDY